MSGEYGNSFVGGSLKVGARTDTHASSVLDVQSTTKGFLPPRMTTAQRDAISSPAAGLVVFNTETGTINQYSGSAWVALGAGGGSSALYINPIITKYASGSGTHNLSYAFVITAGSATAGATYTNNSVTFTVLQTISSGTLLFASGSGAPASSGTLTKASGTGDATLTFSEFRDPLFIEVELVGGGGGGAGSGTTGFGNGTGGGETNFGSTLLVGSGGAGCVAGASQSGVGGSATIDSSVIGINLAGGTGGSSLTFNSTLQVRGSDGGISVFGGNGMGIIGSGASARGNTGSGGAGGSSGGAGSGNITGGGGGAGGYCKGIIQNPSGSYSYAVGALGAGGSAGTSGFAGGNGAAGIILVKEHFQ